MKIKTNKKVKTTETTHITLDRQDIIELLEKEGIDIPIGADIFITVPGGGDYSNQKLGVDFDTPLEIKFTCESTEQK